MGFWHYYDSAVHDIIEARYCIVKLEMVTCSADPIVYRIKSPFYVQYILGQVSILDICNWWRYKLGRNMYSNSLTCLASQTTIPADWSKKAKSIPR